jgi:cytochrome P450
VAPAAELAALELFEGCSPGELAGVAQAVSCVRRLAEGDVICIEGEVADRWWIVADGLADATSRGLYLATIGPGETIGELALLDGAPRSATVKATTDMVVYEVEGEGFVSALLEAPRVALALLREFASRLRLSDERSTRPAVSLPAAAPAPLVVTSATGLLELDPGSEGYFEDPYAHLAAVREQSSVSWSDALRSYVVTRYEDVHRLTRDRSLVGSVATQDPVAALAGLPSDTARRRRMEKSMIRRDGDDHLRLRRLVSKVFTPRAISSWKDTAEAIVEELLAEAAGKDEIDVMAEFALPLPVRVISEMLGMPGSDRSQLRDWSRAITRGLDPSLSPEEDEAATAAARAMLTYVEAVVADKRRHPGEDILTRLIEAEEKGDRLETDEIQAQVILLYIAGHETTANLIGNGLTHLFHYPEQIDLLRSERSLDANAVEETLRFDSPAQFTRRVNREPLQVDGTTIPAGSLVTLALGSANHDPRKWGPTADVLDIARPGANEHVSFGGGPHFCLGNALARLEAQAALPRLVRKFPRMEPAYTQPAWMHRMTLRGVDTLPVSLG